MALTYKEADDFIAAFLAMRANANDALASIAVDVYPELNEDGELIKSGTRIKWNGVLKRAAVDLWDTKENNPENAPTLWEDLDYVDGYRVISDVITVGTAFSMNERGWWKGSLYQSNIANNVYTPEQYPAGWKLVEQA